MSAKYIRVLTLFVDGDAGISIFREQLCGKTPFSISLMAAFITGKQTATASLKSLSWLSSFFLLKITTLKSYLKTRRRANRKKRKTSTNQFSDIDRDGTPQINASLAPATTPE